MARTISRMLHSPWLSLNVICLSKRIRISIFMVTTLIECRQMISSQALHWLWKRLLRVTLLLSLLSLHTVAVPVWDQQWHLLWITLHQLLICEVEEVRKGVTIRQSCRLVAQLIEERMHYGLQRFQTALRVVYEQVRDKVDGFTGSFRAEDLAPSLLSYGREFKLWVAGVHAVNLILGRCSQHFDNLDKLVNARLTWEERLAY